MITVKDAVQKALAYTQEIYAPEQLQNLRFEEVEKTGDDWRVTIGFDREQARPPGPFAQFALPQYRREYKVVEIDANSGEVKALKMRNIA
jgi:hypothetical protein